MVVQGLLALALALPTGLLFGVGYGTGVRIGYEQVYPLLFPPDASKRNVTPTVENIKRINGIYDAIGGKEASQMGIAMGLQGAMEEINRNPDFQALEELELRLSGRTQSRLGTEPPSKEISISDFPSDSSADPNSENYNPEYANFIRMQQGKLPTIDERKQSQDSPFPPGFDFGNKEELLTHGGRPLGTPTGMLHEPLTSSLPEAQAFTIWQGYLISIQNSFLQKAAQQSQLASGTFNQSTRLTRIQPPELNALKKIEKRLREISSEIRTISNDFRNPNNGIRTAVLDLRQEILDGLWGTSFKKHVAYA